MAIGSEQNPHIEKQVALAPRRKKFYVCFQESEGELKKKWDSPEITTEEIAKLGGWDPSIGVVLVNLQDNTERVLEPGEVIELSPGMSFCRRVRFKRGGP